VQTKKVAAAGEKLAAFNAKEAETMAMFKSMIGNSKL
jgi:hypothetical protein